MLHTFFAFGTRPEAIKLAPVILLLKSRPEEFKVTVCLTSQHKELLRQVTDFFGITEDVDLDVMQQNQTLEHVATAVLTRMKETLERFKPDVVLVQGDTTTVFASALAAFYQKIAVGHVEAGLRTGNKYSPFPEEINRRLTAPLTDFHFAPTALARQNLLAEGIPEFSVFVTGNTVVDALLAGKNILASRGETHRRALLLDAGIPEPSVDSMLAGSSRMILVTAHRRESFGEPFEQMCLAMRELVDSFEDTVLVYPVHPNPNVVSVVNRVLSSHPRIHLIRPVAYEQLLLLLDLCAIVLTDSGGIQEEAPSLKKPVLVMREVTERPEGVDAGVARLVGSSREKIVGEASRLLSDSAEYARMATGVNPYGDGLASERIASILLEHCAPRRDS